MSEQPSKRSNSLVSTETKITALFAVLALVLVYGTTIAADSHWVRFAVLLGIGVMTPTLINKWRD